MKAFCALIHQFSYSMQCWPHKPDAVSSTGSLHKLRADETAEPV